MTGIEGRIEIHLHPDNDRVEICSSRPTELSRLLAGRSVAEALRRLPTLFSVCGTAQACAGVRCCEQALGQRAGADAEALRDTLVRMETAREHLWRILLDWPGFLDEPSDRRAMAEASALHQTFRRTLAPGSQLFEPGANLERSNTMAAPAVITKLGRLLEQAVFAMPPEVWVTLEDEAELAEWAAEGETSAARLCDQVLQSGSSGLGRSDTPALPPLPAEALAPRLAEPGFIAAPLWEGSPRETGPLARQAKRPLIRDLSERHGNGLITRLAARLLELALLPTQINRQAPGEGAASHPGPGEGLAQVEAARGRLIHWVRLAEQEVVDYRILAPTEWNFHPQGLVARGIAALGRGDLATRKRQAALLVNAVDPCVDYRFDTR